MPLGVRLKHCLTLPSSVFMPLFHLPVQASSRQRLQLQ